MTSFDPFEWPYSIATIIGLLGFLMFFAIVWANRP